MDLLDTDVLYVARFQVSDPRHGISCVALEVAGRLGGGTTVFNVLEFCGLASFKLPPEELATYSNAFAETFGLNVIYPIFGEEPAEAWFTDALCQNVLAREARHMNVGDAAILWVAEQVPQSRIITWNVGHFQGRTDLAVLTPQNYLHEA